MPAIGYEWGLGRGKQFTQNNGVSSGAMLFTHCSLEIENCSDKNEKVHSVFGVNKCTFSYIFFNF